MPGAVGELGLLHVDEEDDERLMSVLVHEAEQQTATGTLRSATDAITDARRHPLGTTKLAWASAITKACSTRVEDSDQSALFATGEGRVLLQAAIIGPSNSSRAHVLQLALTIIWMVALPLCFHILGFSVLFVATMVIQSLNHFFKLMACRFETFVDGGAPDNPTVQVWRLAPAQVTVRQRQRLAKNLSFGSTVPGAGPHGNLINMLVLIPLAVHNWGTLATWEVAVLIMTTVLSLLPQLAVPTCFTQLFLNSCACLVGAIDTIGIWEEEICNEPSGDDLPRLSKACPFKAGYSNFGAMSKLVHAYSRSWTFYFFFAEFLLVLGLLSAALGVRAEARALTVLNDAGEGENWPQVIRLMFACFGCCIITFYVVVVFTAAASISSACQRVLGRIHTLHEALAAHSPELQPECTRFHNHVARGDLGFKAMGITVTFRLGASIMYPVITGVGVLMMTFLPTVLEIN
eukprot:COSAG03_NODE_22_length_20538_cov_27.667286_17_plen_462_part_00